MSSRKLWNASSHILSKQRLIERARAKKQEQVPAGERPPAPADSVDQQNVVKTGIYGKSQVLVEVLPMIFYGENGKRGNGPARHWM